MNSITAFLIIMALLIAIPFSGNAQSTGPEPETAYKLDYKLRPFRIGAKVGFPNLIGGNIEYVTPLLNKKLALNIDYSSLKSDWFLDDNIGNANTENANFSYLEGGLNYYLFKPGKGLYAGVAYNSISFEGSKTYNDGSTDYIDETHNSFAVKLGAKLGGLFYFRPEIGYSFSALPSSFQVVNVSSSGERETYREDLNTEMVPEFLLKGFIANIGFGFAF